MMNHQLSGARDGTTYRHRAPQTSLSSLGPKTSRYKTAVRLTAVSPQKQDLLRGQVKHSVPGPAEQVVPLRRLLSPLRRVTSFPETTRAGHNGKLVGLTLLIPLASTAEVSMLFRHDGNCIENVAALRFSSVPNPGLVGLSDGWKGAGP